MPDPPAAPPRPLERPPPGDLLLIALAVGAVSTSAPLIRQAAAPALAIALWRNVLAAGVLAPVAGLRRRQALRTMTTRTRRLAIGAGALLAAHFATWIPSLSYTTVASSVALVATQPVWAALLARRRGEHVPRAAWGGIALALTGAIVLTGVDLTFSARALFGDLLALCGGVLAAAYVTVGAEVRRDLDTTSYTFVCYSTAAVALLGVCLATGQTLHGYPGRTWASLIALTAGPQLLGHSVFNRVLRTTSPTVVSVAILFEIVGATLLAALWFGERPHLAAVPAALLIGGGVLVVVRSGRSPAVATAGVVE